MVHRKLNPAPVAEIPRLQAVQAILILRGEYVLQLRDNKPDIESPGQWSLFGGEVNPEEHPGAAIQREIQEELCISPAGYDFLWFTDYSTCLGNTPVRSWFYVADVDAVWSRHLLKEGADVRVFSFNETLTISIPPVMRETLTRFHKHSQKN